MAEYKIVDAEKLDADLSSVADAIRTKGGTSESLTFPQGFVDAVGAIESGGGDTEEIENLIDQSGVLGTTDETVTVTDKVEQLIDKAETAKALKTISFMGNHTIEKIIFDCKNITSLRQGFRDCANLKTVLLTNTGNVWEWNYAFLVSTNIETVEVLDMSRATSGLTAYWLPNAPNIKFVPQTIKTSLYALGNTNLSAESVQSFFDGLDPKATGQTLTFPPVFNNEDAEATVNANIEEIDGVKRIKGKEGWTLVR